jgi:hypothetical protein
LQAFFHIYFYNARYFRPACNVIVRQKTKNIPIPPEPFEVNPKHNKIQADGGMKNTYDATV